MKDNMEILGSPLGMYSLLRGDFVISILKDDGSLDEEKLGTLVAQIANMGANGLRDFYWIDSPEAYKLIAPFWRDSSGKVEFNDNYYLHQRTIAQTCNIVGMRYYLSIFDHCGTKVSKTGVGQFNPWRSFDDFFYGEDAKELRHEYIDRILNAFDGLDTGIELCNEPEAGHSDFLVDTFLYLHNKGFLPENIILGIDYHLKESNSDYGKDYRQLRDGIVKALNDADWKKLLKTRCISPVHNATIENIDDLWGPNVKPGGDRRILYSMDGVQKPRPDKEMMTKIGRKVLEKKTEAREKQKVLFEVVFGKTKSDPLDSIQGISEAYKYIWGEYPTNYGKYSDTVVEVPEEGTTDSSNEEVIRRAYLGILGRPVDDAGKKAYLDFLGAGGSVLSFCKKLTISNEYLNQRKGLPVQELAAALYRGILDREPDTEGLEHTAQMIQGGQIAERAAAMLESNEFGSGC